MPKGKVMETIDGDTVRIKGGKYLRLEGVDTPEKGTKGFAKAKNELADIIEGKNVSYTEEGKSYGRIVSQVKVGSKSVNTTMKRKGYGV